MAEQQIGNVSDYFSKIGVAAIELFGELSVGDKVRVKGHTTDFETEVNEIQINKESVDKAGQGDHIGIKIPEKARPNDKVFLVSD